MGKKYRFFQCNLFWILLTRLLRISWHYSGKDWYSKTKYFPSLSMPVTSGFHLNVVCWNSCYSGSGSCKMNCCNVRESNPGRPRGRRAFYHWTNVAGMLFGYSYNPTPCWKSLFRNLSIYNPNTDWYSFTPERLIWLAVSRLWQ